MWAHSSVRYLPRSVLAKVGYGGRRKRRRGGARGGVPACLHAVPEDMRAELEQRARWSRLQAEEDEALAAEPFGERPTLGEFLALEAALGSPLHAAVEEAEADLAAEATEPGCARSPAGRKEALVEQHQYVGGVTAEQRRGAALRGPRPGGVFLENASAIYWWIRKALCSGRRFTVLGDGS